MFNDIHWSLSLSFLLTLLLTAGLFYRALYVGIVRRNFLILSIFWCGFQSLLSASGWYLNTAGLPPRFAWVVIPPVVLILYWVFSKKHQAWIQQIDLQALTYMHLIRVPVEFILLMLFYAGKIPQMMTFEGHNFDIFSGLTAGIIGYFGFKNQKMVLIWNVVCLILLGIIVGTAAFALPTPLQKIAFEQPNIAVLRFPFVLLPGYIVQIVFFAHLVAIKRLYLNATDSTTYNNL